jgi:hypothetical protein
MIVVMPGDFLSLGPVSAGIDYNLSDPEGKGSIGRPGDDHMGLQTHVPASLSAMGTKKI